jgi:hypothetical protein
MSIDRFDRRQFLALPLAFLLAPILAPAGRALAEMARRRGVYHADMGLLYELFSFHLDGTIDETIDRGAGRYEITIAGQGKSMANRIESTGRLREGRWAPLQTRSRFQVYGRESSTEVTYDYDRARIAYRARSETFLLRRLRAVDDVLTLPEGLHVDDSISATLNYAEGLWPAQAEGRRRTHVVRRKMADDEGPDDVATSYHAELTPFDLVVEPAKGGGKTTAQIDLSRFSSWARTSRPARIVFGADGRPEQITTSLILGSSIRIRLSSV